MESRWAVKKMPELSRYRQYQEGSFELVVSFLILLFTYLELQLMSLRTVNGHINENTVLFQARPTSLFFHLMRSEHLFWEIEGGGHINQNLKLR